MSALLNALQSRANNTCELCGASDNLDAVVISPRSDAAENACLACDTCRAQIELSQSPSSTGYEINHLNCLRESIWSQVPPVQVASYRLLCRLTDEPWAVEVLDGAYLEEENLTWAKNGFEQTSETSSDSPQTVDSNGTVLQDGDSVTLIKDLNVKGANFVAKQGTLVKGIRLTDNPEHVEGRVNKTSIVLKTCFLKKS